MIYYVRNITCFIALGTDYRRGLYLILWHLLSYLLIPKSRSGGHGKIDYLTPSSLDREAMNENSKETWFVMLTAPWSKTSDNARHTFADLSTEYGSDKFKFGELEVSRWPKVAKKLEVTIDTLPHQLPTFLLFKQGKLVKRYPQKDQDWERWNRLRALLIGHFELDMVAAKDL